MERTPPIKTIGELLLEGKASKEVPTGSFQGRTVTYKLPDSEKSITEKQAISHLMEDVGFSEKVAKNYLANYIQYSPNKARSTKKTESAGTLIQPNSSPKAGEPLTLNESHGNRRLLHDKKWEVDKPETLERILEWIEASIAQTNPKGIEVKEISLNAYYRSRVDATDFTNPKGPYLTFLLKNKEDQEILVEFYVGGSSRGKKGVAIDDLEKGLRDKGLLAKDYKRDVGLSEERVNHKLSGSYDTFR